MKMGLLEVVVESQSNKKMLKAMNATFLTLIPKQEGVHSLDLFRPITLCNIVYKIITKLIIERLKPWLGHLISKERGFCGQEIDFRWGCVFYRSYSFHEFL